MQNVFPLLRLRIHIHQRVKHLGAHHDFLLFEFVVNLAHHFELVIFVAPLIRIEVAQHAGHLLAHELINLELVLIDNENFAELLLELGHHFLGSENLETRQVIRHFKLEFLLKLFVVNDLRKLERFD